MVPYESYMGDMGDLDSIPWSLMSMTMGDVWWQQRFQDYPLRTNLDDEPQNGTANLTGVELGG